MKSKLTCRDILRLTALFHARRGRSFLSSLSVREGRNYQFDFLRPTHSLFGYYNRLVESYQKIISPAPGTIETLVKETTDPSTKWKTLAEARNRAEWERGKRKREDERKKEKDEETEAMGLIDWQDFVLVETIEFTQADMELELPPPTNVERLKSMSMAEKRMASMVMEEVGSGANGVGSGAGAGVGGGGGAVDAEEVEMEDDDEGEEARLQRIKAEQEQARARDVQRAAMQSRGVKIKTDYTPKGKSLQARCVSNVFHPPIPSFSHSFLLPLFHSPIQPAPQSLALHFPSSLSPAFITHSLPIPSSSLLASLVVRSSALTSRNPTRKHHINSKMPLLCPIHPRKRVIRTYPNRAPRSKMERTKTYPRNASKSITANGFRNRYFHFPPKPRFSTYRFVWR